jgi:hypothetical protein
MPESVDAGRSGFNETRHNGGSIMSIIIRDITRQNMATKREANLEADYAKANARVDAADEARQDAIHALIDAEFAYAELLEVWSPLYERMKARNLKV